MDRQTQMEYVSSLPISEEAKEYWQTNQAFFDSGWNALLNRPRVSELLSLAELQCCGIVDIRIIPLHATTLPCGVEIATLRRSPEEYEQYRNQGKNGTKWHKQ